MKNKFNFKIVGSGPTGLLLSIALSKFDCNIFLTDLLTKDRLIDKDKTYAITHSTRKILSKFRLWEKLEPFLFGFDTLSISDSVTSAFTNLSTSDLDDDISSAKISFCRRCISYISSCWWSGSKYLLERC